MTFLVGNPVDGRDSQWVQEKLDVQPGLGQSQSRVSLNLEQVERQSQAGVEDDIPQQKVGMVVVVDE